jgi:hypothetical protein
MLSFEERLSKLKSKYEEREGGQYLELKTGEIIPAQEYDEVLKTFSKKFINKMSQEPAKCGIDAGIYVGNRKPITKKKVIKKSYYTNGDFTIMYRIAQKKIDSFELDIHTEFLYYKLATLLVHPYNLVQIDGVEPSFPELAKHVKMSERKMYSSMKKLEELGVIKFLNAGHKKAIYMNPEYFATGPSLDKHTLILFGIFQTDDK